MHVSIMVRAAHGNITFGTSACFECSVNRGERNSSVPKLKRCLLPHQNNPSPFYNNVVIESEYTSIPVLRCKII